MVAPLSLGLDVGSTTVKAVVFREQELVFSDYRRHHADVRGELQQLLLEINQAFPMDRFVIAMTGSGGLSISQSMGIQFVQEVIAGTAAIEKFIPDADVVIELGGEDAKITYLHPTPEQRMNGTCAGGTGAFIDQMAQLLHTDASGLNELAAQYDNLYPIASRCGVFAKSDVQPLLNQGAAHSDISASVFQAVATQTIAGLACGHPIKGNVVFLGGPLHYLPELRAAYERALTSNVEKFINPENSQLFVAMGAAIMADRPALSLPHIVANLERAKSLPMASRTMRPLFLDEAELTEFVDRHSQHRVDRAELAAASGPLYLGIDAGSTTIKSILLDEDHRILHSTYGSNEGDPVAAAVQIAQDVLVNLPADAWIARACVTGYGESLVQTALHADEGEIETMAHYRAAQSLLPGVTSVIDIGGQDMKFLRIRNGAVDSIAVNEACSSGCGSFLQTFAQTMGTTVQDFAQVGLQSASPVDLGSRCTVFMNSSVKQAQKEGATIGDISAGLSYSVVRNALYKVIKLRDAGELGDKVVVQGGTFLNDAVLRAFELLTETNVVRPNISGHMGAYGAALTAQLHCADSTQRSGIMSRDFASFQVESAQKVCRLCPNHCKLTITTFDDGNRNVSGNRCERGASLDAKPAKSEVPNLYDYKYHRIFGYRRLTDAAAIRGEIGIPRALGMYEDYPLWFTLLTHLGFKVVLSGRSSHELFISGMESITSENICYPAKLAHGHIEWLLEKGVQTIFNPCVRYERKEFADADDKFNCPVVAYYPQVLEKNVEGLGADGVRYLSPFVNLDDPDLLATRIVEIFADWNVTLAEAKAATAAGYAELDQVRRDILAEGDRAMQYLRERGLRGIVLAGRPYHVDPEVNHGIPELIRSLGMVVLSEDAIVGNEPSKLHRPLRVRDQWVYHTRLYEAAAIVREDPDLSLVQLNSFGCGIDAVTTDQVQEILEAANDVYTVLKIDEVSNLGAARIRLRSLKAAIEERPQSVDVDTTGVGKAILVPTSPPSFTKEAAKTHTIYVPQMAPIHFRFLIPVLTRAGYRAELLAVASHEDVELGLKYVNNDACYPAIMVIGQLINKFVTGAADPDNATVAISQTGGMCRATNYAGMLRKGLADAGFPQVPVLAVSLQGLESNPGFKVSLPMLHQGIQALIIGDVLQNVLLRVRPYESVEGSATELYQKWDVVSREFLAGGYSTTLGRRVGYDWLLRNMVREFDELPLLDIPRKPRVGLVGEILVKFQPDANNHAVQVIEDEGCEAVLPGLFAFFSQNTATGDWARANVGATKRSVWGRKIARHIFEAYERPAREALASAGGKFDVPEDVETMASRSDKIISRGTQAGEGWLLVAEMMELIEHGTPNIICAQPFACLPNHVVGRGMFKAVREEYPHANIVSIDYDPGASEVNQLNRIKLMVATAHKNAGTSPRLANWTVDDEVEFDRYGEFAVVD